MVLDFNTIANEYSIYLGFVLAALVFVLYLWNHRSKIAFLNVSGILLASHAVIGGMALCYKVLSNNWCTLSQSERIYVFLGGLAVVWNAFMSIKRLIQKP